MLIDTYLFDQDVQIDTYLFDQHVCSEKQVPWAIVLSIVM